MQELLKHEVALNDFRRIRSAVGRRRELEARRRRSSRITTSQHGTNEAIIVPSPPCGTSQHLNRLQNG